PTRGADSVAPAPVPTTRNPAVPGLRNTGTQNPHLTAALAVLFVLIIQTIRRERPEDRMYYAALGGSISAAMILVPSFLFTQAGLSRELAALLISFGLLALWITIFGLRLNARTSR
ncbi:hypothetical protein ACL1IP_12735, partial [Corynebacterium striatum]